MKPRYLFTAVLFYFLCVCLLTLFIEKGTQFGLVHISNGKALAGGSARTASVEYNICIWNRYCPLWNAFSTLKAIDLEAN